MPFPLLFQVVALLIGGQVLAGALGHALGQAIPWLGMPFTVLWLWLILRVAVVAAEEEEQGGGRTSWRMPALVILLWQLPTLITLPFWAPPWVFVWLHGVWTPVTATLAYIWPGLASAPLWPFLVAEVGLFVWASTRSALRVQAVVPALPRAVLDAQAQQVAAIMPAEEAPAQAANEDAASGPNREWVAARRVKDVRRKRLTLPKGE
jgi:hypothetical protein